VTSFVASFLNGEVRPWWHEHAACSDLDSFLFYVPGDEPHFAHREPGARKRRAIEAARQVCNGCTVRLECLAAGLDEQYGVWGGRSAMERVQLRRLRDEGGEL
jgi:hypothetical protein